MNRVAELEAALRAVLDAMPVQHESHALRRAVLHARIVVGREIVASYIAKEIEK